MRLNIPQPRARLKLVSDWTFELPNFYWNQLIWAKLFGTTRKEPFHEVTLRAGTVLVVTKIDFRPEDPYPIRFGLLRKHNPSTVVFGRFWVTLAAANAADVVVLTEETV